MRSLLTVIYQINKCLSSSKQAHICERGPSMWNVPCIIQIYSVYKLNLSFSQLKFLHIIIIITSESFFIVFGLKAFLCLFSKAVRRAEIKSQPQKQTEVKELLPKRKIFSPALKVSLSFVFKDLKISSSKNQFLLKTVLFFQVSWNLFASVGKSQLGGSVQA